MSNFHYIAYSQLSLLIIHSSFCKTAIFTFLFHDSAVSGKGALICTDTPYHWFNNQWLLENYILPSNNGYFPTRLRKKWVTTSQILMLYFWLRICLNAFSIACHWCRVEVPESLSGYAVQRDSFWPGSQQMWICALQPASLPWCLQDLLGREDTEVTNMER